METVAVALIAGLLGPSILLLVKGWIDRIDKREDWARQDAVAKRADEANAALLKKTDDAKLQAQKDAAKLLLAQERQAEQLATVAKNTDTQLLAIHTLVNSNLTISKRGELLHAEGWLASINEIVALRGVKPSPATLAQIKQMESHITELRAELADRLEQQQVVDAMETE